MPSKKDCSGALTGEPDFAGGGDAGAVKGVANVEGAGGGQADAAADLGSLEGEALAGELEVAHAEGGAGVAFGDGDVGLGGGGGDLAGDVVGEAGGDVFRGGVVEHAAAVDGGEGDAGRRPGREPRVEDPFRGRLWGRRRR